MRNFQCAPKNSLIFQSWLHLRLQQCYLQNGGETSGSKYGPRTSSISLTKEPVASAKYQDPPQTPASETLGVGLSNLCFNSPPDNYETWSNLSIEEKINCVIWIHDVTYKELLNFGRYDWSVYNKICDNISCIVRACHAQSLGFLQVHI